MKKFAMTLLALLACATSGVQAQYSTYYKDMPVEVRQVEPFAIADRSVNLAERGATGDGATLNTDIIQKAIDELSQAGGGHLVIPQGVWLTGPIELKSGVDLHLERNAILYFSPDKALYIDSNPKASRVRACISANRCRNISITGLGTLDGNGAQWRPVKRSKVSDVEWKRFRKMGGVERQNGSLWYPWELKSGYPDVADTPEKQEKKRNDLFRINNLSLIHI